MKRFLLLLIVLTLISASALAELPDFSAMSFEELQTMKTALDKEYYSREEVTTRTLYPGKYVIGEDIAAGNYVASMTEMPDRYNEVATFGVYKNTEDYETVQQGSYARAIIEGSVYFGDKPGSLTLEAGEVLYIGRGSLTIATPGTDFTELYQYEPPEGTYVPAGDYHVPEDIPEGTYQVYATDVNVLRFGIYHSEEKYAENITYHYGQDESFRYFVSKSDPYTTIVLKEGYVLYAENNMIMKKQPKLSFDD